MNRKTNHTANILFTILISSLVISSCVLIEEPTPQPATDTATPADVIIPNTATPPATMVVDTGTPLPSDTPQADTPMPTSTPLPSLTPTNTATFTPSPTPVPFALQTGSPAYIQNFAYPEDGCDWLGVAGQVFGGEGEPLVNLVVLVTGTYDGKTIEMIGVTGTVSGDTYGPGGYELVLSDTPMDTTEQLVAQVFDLDGNPLSDVVPLDTFANCDSNLIILNFSPQ